MTWLAHALPGDAGGVVLRGPGASPARGARRVNAVLAAVRGMTVHAVAEGTAGGHLVPVLYEVADDRDLPGEARGGDGRMSWRLRARHRACEVDAPVSRAADADIAALLAACVSARDRLIVMLLARAGLRRGEAAGLRRSDVHLLADSRLLGCAVPRAHLHVVRREDNPNGAWAKSRRQRVVRPDFLTVQAFDTCQLERAAVAAAADGDFVLVNLFVPRSGRRCGWMRSTSCSALRRGGRASTRRCARTSCGMRSDRISLMPATASTWSRRC
jgi:integrase/recombinase XerD